MGGVFKAETVGELTTGDQGSPRHLGGEGGGEDGGVSVNLTVSEGSAPATGVGLWHGLEACMSI